MAIIINKQAYASIKKYPIQGSQFVYVFSHVSNNNNCFFPNGFKDANKNIVIDKSTRDKNWFGSSSSIFENTQCNVSWNADGITGGHNVECQKDREWLTVHPKLVGSDTRHYINGTGTENSLIYYTVTEDIPSSKINPQALILKNLVNPITPNAPAICHVSFYFLMSVDPGWREAGSQKILMKQTPLTTTLYQPLPIANIDTWQGIPCSTDVIRTTEETINYDLLVVRGNMTIDPRLYTDGTLTYIHIPVLKIPWPKIAPSGTGHLSISSVAVHVDVCDYYSGGSFKYITL